MGQAQPQPRRRRPAIVLVALLAGLTQLPALASIVAGKPDAIICSVKDPTGVLPWEQLVYYVSARMADGTVLYKTLTSDPVVLLVSDDGIIDGDNLADCDGRSVDSLREEGRAFTLAR
jgi:hypothetical protein